MLYNGILAQASRADITCGCRSKIAAWAAVQGTHWRVFQEVLWQVQHLVLQDLVLLQSQVQSSPQGRVRWSCKEATIAHPILQQCCRESFSSYSPQMEDQDVILLQKAGCPPQGASLSVLHQGEGLVQGSGQAIDLCRVDVEACLAVAAEHHWDLCLQQTVPANNSHSHQFCASMCR
jgi:hypothetical protein